MENEKTVFITGANQGLGFATAKKLLERGYFVYLGSRDMEKGKAAGDELKTLGLERFEIVQIDVTDIETIEAAMEKLQQSIPHLDILINNAGITGPVKIDEDAKEMEQDFSTLPLEDLRAVFDVNFFGVIQVTQSFLPLLRKSLQPKIINVTSGLGSLTNHTDPDAPFYDFFKDYKLSAYNSSKTSLNAFTVFLADELKDTPFQINSVSPGFGSTNLNNYTGTQPPDEAVKAIIDFATMGEKTPTGGFYDENGEIAW